MLDFPILFAPQTQEKEEIFKEEREKPGRVERWKVSRSPHRSRAPHSPGSKGRGFRWRFRRFDWGVFGISKRNHCKAERPYDQRGMGETTPEPSPGLWSANPANKVNVVILSISVYLIRTSHAIFTVKICLSYVMVELWIKLLLPPAVVSAGKKAERLFVASCRTIIWSVLF